MSKTPKVSVLTPLYNTAPDNLRAMIESVLNQTFSDFEFLLLNDSPDNRELEKIIKSYNDARIKYFDNTENLGITQSRNKLIEMSCGEYLAIVDHDDISLQNRFQLEVDFLDKNPHVGVVGGNFTEARDGVHWNQTHFPENDNDIKLFLINEQGCVPNHPTAMIRKSVLTETGIRYDESWSPCEDHALLLDLIPHTCFHSLHDVVLKYVWHGNNTTIRQWQRMIDLLPLMVCRARERFPVYYQEWQRLQHNAMHTPSAAPQYTKKFRLLGFIPILKIKYAYGQKKVYLFDFIQLYRWK